MCGSARLLVVWTFVLAVLQQRFGPWQESARVAMHLESPANHAPEHPSYE